MSFLVVESSNEEWQSGQYFRGSSLETIKWCLQTRHSKAISSTIRFPVAIQIRNNTLHVGVEHLAWESCSIASINMLQTTIQCFVTLTKYCQLSAKVNY